jgi:hypothetical protein
MHSVRIAISAAITVVLLLASAVASVAGDAELAGSALDGAGIGAVFTTMVALGLADAAARGWRQPDGGDRMPVVRIGLLGILWGCIRVGLGDPTIVPAIAGLTWCCVQGALFIEPKEEDEPEAPDPGLD